MLISVIIPVYNTGEILRETVQSVLDQTFRDFELLLIDDGSGEETRKIVDSFTDPRIRVIRQENRGIAGARNRGIEEARGTYIAFLDHDDLWLPEKLAVQLQMLENDQEAALCYSPVIYFGDVTPERAVQFEKISGWAAEALMHCNKIVSTSCILVRKKCFEVIGGFDPVCVPCDDWDFYLQLSYHFRILVTEKTLVKYRLYTGNTSADRERMYHAEIRMLQKHQKLFPLYSEHIPFYPKLKKNWHKKYALNCYGLAWYAAWRGECIPFLRWIFPAIFHDGTLWCAWLLLPRFPFWKLRKWIIGENND